MKENSCRYLIYITHICLSNNLVHLQIFRSKQQTVVDEGSVDAEPRRKFLRQAVSRAHLHRLRVREDEIESRIPGNSEKYSKESFARESKSATSNAKASEKRKRIEKDAQKCKK